MDTLAQAERLVKRLRVGVGLGVAVAIALYLFLLWGCRRGDPFALIMLAALPFIALVAERRAWQYYRELLLEPQTRHPEQEGKSHPQEPGATG
jgi:hypothetical protein